MLPDVLPKAISQLLPRAMIAFFNTKIIYTSFIRNSPSTNSIAKKKAIMYNYTILVNRMYMTKINAFSTKFIKEITEQLQAEKSKLQKELGQFSTENPHVKGDYDAVYPEYGDKEDENAQEIAEYAVNKPLELSLEKTLRDIEKAFVRIEDGTYGICKYCDEPIAELRLQARPTSSSCVSCKKTLKEEA